MAIPGNLIVKPITAQLKRDVDFGSSMSPYVVIKIQGQTKKGNPHSSGGKQPSWNDTMSFNIQDDYTADIKVYDKDLLSSDDIIGQTTISILDIQQKGKMAEWYTLEYKGKSAGKILLESEFHRVQNAPSQGTGFQNTVLNYNSGQVIGMQISGPKQVWQPPQQQLGGFQQQPQYQQQFGGYPQQQVQQPQFGSYPQQQQPQIGGFYPPQQQQQQQQQFQQGGYPQQQFIPQQQQLQQFAMNISNLTSSQKLVQQANPQFQQQQQIPQQQQQFGQMFTSIQYQQPQQQQFQQQQPQQFGQPNYPL